MDVPLLLEDEDGRRKAPYGAAMRWRSGGYAAVAAGLSVLVLAQAVADGRSAAWVVPALVGTAGVAVALRAPVLLAGLATASVVAQLLLVDADPAFASFLALVVCSYALGRHSSRAGLLLGMGLVATAVAAITVADPTLRQPFELVYPVVYFGGAAAVGRLARSRERAATQAAQALAAAAESRAQEALAQERARIAREMHDVVAHSISMLVVQAESAAAVLDRDPERARTQLDRISSSGRQALEELRRVLGLLHRGSDEGGAHPQPGLADLATLRETVQAAGPTVEMHVDDELLRTAPGVQLTAYRVVQEALTNAVRHGRPGHVWVDVRRCGGAVTVDVRDDGTAAPATSPPGHGLLGMRERVRLYDGELEAGPVDGGGFRVAARLPVAP